MLIEFSVTNFRSVRDRQTLSLVKASGKEELVQTNTFKAQAFREFDLLRSAAIYGPNAGGKTNVLLALRTMQQIVLGSATSQKRGDKLPVTPFRLSQTTSNAPSVFEVVFIVNHVRYQYGFSATEDRIHEEWLLAYPKGRPQRWFDRAWNVESSKYDWELGNNLLGEKQLWQKSTRDNALFLSTAVQLNSQQLQPIYDWFSDTLYIVNLPGLAPTFSASLCEKSKEKQEIMDYLRAADLNIEDVIAKKKPFDIKELPDDMPEHVKNTIAGELEGKELIKIKTIHKSSEGDTVSFDFKDESDGTQKLFSFAGPWIDTLSNGYVLFIDELHDNLHPQLVRFLVQLFHSSETNPKNAQLVFTTHETSILNQEVFRRDQIWFCEKGQDQATTLYPLTDFHPRKGRENLELAYLSGRYGALPYIKPLKTHN
ncbi:MAG: AAA family ATPase [Candidatus Nitrospinota bacterium M3_3B_026]